MTDPYSVLLLLAIAALVAAWAALLLGRRSPAIGRFGHVGRLTVPLAVTAFLLDLAATVVHVAGGHRPGTAGAMTGWHFAAAHPALIVVGALALTALALRPKTT